ncbi:gliding motility lipoprotein GldD [Flavobacterium sp.]|uniref:gliding motility lipoprotein GldD n=1 Tax=Flavobacterium sp. TaxID=239 RepID=UPI002487EA2B|nr:gliding motility lipoprotein GldD [Flavobacterium sp.]MDI1316050.1 gliding motility lipoprotein GldD [Flavobacterium sp.]
MFRKIIGSLAVSTLFVCMSGCKNDTVPKPSSQLRLDYPVAKYAKFSNNCPFEFDFNANATIEEDKNCGYSIHYPKMKATIYLTYKTVDNNINALLRDAQKLTYEHVIKADDILEQPFINNDSKVYGMFYRVNGNAATNAQFYATDSIKHFVTGSVYFYAKPKFDSIMPAASYVKDDMQRLMETLKWK